MAQAQGRTQSVKTNPAWDAEIRKFEVQSQPGKILHETLSQK
jgi:hypothetical protein